MKVSVSKIVHDYTFGLAKILDYTPQQSEELHEMFKKMIAARVLESTQGALTSDERRLSHECNSEANLSSDDPRIPVLKQALYSHFSREDLEMLTIQHFAGILYEYIVYMEDVMDEDQIKAVNTLYEDAALSLQR